ncbi:MAG: methyltransferase domain-containing protein [Candidatus Latescibacteria bacterium]|nr:methyltransferase domain-containing protein [Candidatus Latescibacterota bacterium]
MPDKIIPFYGTAHPHLFAIERRAMDKEGRVIDYLDPLLPSGMVLDIGAGNGYTAQKLTRPQRKVVALEPSADMIDTQTTLPWVQSVAQELPFPTDSFSGAYATWAYFFPTYHGYGQTGLDELHRIVKPKHPLVIVDNAGDDEFCRLFERDIASDAQWWQAQGFERHIIHTHYQFDSMDEAEELLAFYWSNNGRAEKSHAQLKIGYSVAVYTQESA